MLTYILRELKCLGGILNLKGVLKKDSTLQKINHLSVYLTDKTCFEKPAAVIEECRAIAHPGRLPETGTPFYDRVCTVTLRCDRMCTALAAPSPPPPPPPHTLTHTLLRFWLWITISTLQCQLCLCAFLNKQYPYAPKRTYLPFRYFRLRWMVSSDFARSSLVAAFLKMV